jgi:DNA-binding response OmpR family regulator
MRDLGVAAKLRAAFELSPTDVIVVDGRPCVLTASGFDAYLVKPVEAKDLVAVVSRLLRG